MNERERRVITAKLASSRERLLGVVDGLTPEQWRFRPGEGRWSINECVEHITTVENRVFGMIGKKLAGPPAPPDSSPSTKDGEVAMRLADRTVRRVAPEPSRPAGKWPDARELLAEFRKARSLTERFAAETDADLRSYTQTHGAFGELDCYQWLLLLGGHAERHALQIEEIKADSQFPSG